MAKLAIRRFATPDETRQFVAKGRAEILTFGGGVVGRGIFEPGWKWSKHVKPLAGTASCQIAHSGYMVSGRMHLVMDDGTEAEIGPGDYAIIPPGHDGWTVGNETCVFVDFIGMEDYARPGRELRGSAEPEQPGIH